MDLKTNLPVYFPMHAAPQYQLEERVGGIRFKPHQIMALFQFHSKKAWMNRLKMAFNKKINLIKNGHYPTCFLVDPPSSKFTCVDLTYVPVLIRDDKSNEYIEIESADDIEAFAQIYFKAFLKKDFKVIFQSSHKIDFSNCQNISLFTPKTKKLPSSTRALKPLTMGDDDEDDDDNYYFGSAQVYRSVNDNDEESDEDYEIDQKTRKRRKRMHKDHEGLEPSKRQYVDPKQFNMMIKDLMKKFDAIDMLQFESQDEYKNMIEENISIATLSRIKVPDIPDFNLFTKEPMLTGKDFLGEFVFWAFNKKLITERVRELLEKLSEKFEPNPQYNRAVYVYAHLLAYLTKQNALEKNIDPILLLDSVVPKIPEPNVGGVY